MHPTFEILGLSIPAYWLCMMTGVSVCSVTAFFRHRRFEELQEVDIINSAALLFIGVVIGSKFLYILTILPIVIRNRQLLLGDLKLAYEVIGGGMVFYGGLIGALVTLRLYVRKYHLDSRSFFDYFAPLFPLFHCFGRIGCFLNGCCHGKVSERFGIAFENSPSALNGVPYFPIQLVCSLGELILFFIVRAYEKKHHRSGKAMVLYLALYAAGRFVIEFFRGDMIRGIWAGLSTSQWISLAILLTLLIRQYRAFNRNGASPAA